MTKKTILSVFLLAMTGGCDSPPAYPDLNDVPEIKNQEKDLFISTQFIRKKFHHNFTFSPYTNDSPTIDYQEKSRVKISNIKLAKAIFAKNTFNPFKTIYTDIYNNYKKGKYNDCDFIGIKFELDNNKITQEWYIAFHGEFCSYRDKSIVVGSGHGTHAWILQRKNSGKYVVLMETDGLIVIASSKQEGYKIINTNANLKNIYRAEFYRTRYVTNYKKNRPCGEGKIEWKYQQGRYIPFRLYPYKGCISYYDGVAEGQISSDIYVQDRLLEWVSKIMKKKMVLTKDNYLVSVRIGSE